MMQQIQLPVKNVASILQRAFPGEEHFLQANEGKVITFIIVNNHHAIHRIRVSIPRNEFLAVFASYPLQQPPHQTNPCLFCVFVPLSPSSFRRAHRILPQKAVEDMTCVSVDCPCLFLTQNIILCARVVACTPRNDHCILVPRGRAPFGQHQESRPLARSNDIPILIWICKHNRLRPEPIRFVRLDSEHAQSDGKSVNRGLPLLDTARGRDSWC